MKKILCFIICAALLAAALAACGTQGGSKNEHTIYIRDEYKHDGVTATFFNSNGGDKKEVKAKPAESTEKYTEFTCAADPTLYDRVILTTDDKDTVELAFNEHTHGWVLNSQRVWPNDSGCDPPKTDRHTFEYENRTKNVFIWTPDDYDPKGEKCAVIYMPDGQNLFVPTATSTGSWAVAESARAMLEESDIRTVIVGIETDGAWRDSELTPDIGEVQSEEYKDGKGEYFSDFVVNTVMPYIEENYNVYTDREHTHICGSSSGGIESFYIAMEHPDKFGSVGALSPAFILYGDKTWEKYLSEKDFSAGYPTVYMYCGNSKTDELEQLLYAGTVSMSSTLKKAGYPEDKYVTKIYEDGGHKELYWRVIFPDYLRYAFPVTSDYPER
nr:alpha/beta hydrolase-fold protein [uncultured Ruminococcus sp.]